MILMYTLEQYIMPLPGTPSLPPGSASRGGSSYWPPAPVREVAHANARAAVPPDLAAPRRQVARRRQHPQNHRLAGPPQRRPEPREQLPHGLLEPRFAG